MASLAAVRGGAGRLPRGVNVLVILAAGLVVTLVASWRRPRPAAHVLLGPAGRGAPGPPPSRPGRDRRRVLKLGVVIGSGYILLAPSCAETWPTGLAGCPPGWCSTR
jgi:hypothetical protein